MLKTNQFKNLGFLLCVIFLSACNREECAECHVVVEFNGVEYEIMELGEYCEDLLHDIEENGYTIEDTIINDVNGNILPIPLMPGASNEVHCGEEHNHDH